MVGIFDCGGVLGKYEIRLKERKVVNMEALNTYKTENRWKLCGGCTDVSKRNEMEHNIPPSA